MTMKRRLAEFVLEKSYIAGEVVLTSGKKSDLFRRQADALIRGRVFAGELFLIAAQDSFGIGGL
jgi:orotate phosphoribosyltransferase